ncbi:MAG: queC [Ignavibacteria bacterium]|nr:queC [Ignavibacteria bacterium]
MSLHNKLAVVLMSGGMDSAVCAAIARKEGFNLAALHVSYGQLTQAREQKAFHDLADYFKALTRMVVDIDYLAKIGGSSLTDSRIELHLNSGQSHSIPNTYIPFRNANLLAIATSWAEVIGAEAIYIGAMQQDYSGYPDCREEFFEAFGKAIQTGTKPETKIEIKTPIINYRKQDIVRIGLEMKVPFELTWSCYQNSDEACGECDSCRLRLKGFREAGRIDPITYKK